jgi:hypothetical protein
MECLRELHLERDKRKKEIRMYVYILIVGMEKYQQVYGAFSSKRKALKKLNSPSMRRNLKSKTCTILRVKVDSMLEESSHEMALYWLAHGHTGIPNLSDMELLKEPKAHEIGTVCEGEEPHDEDAKK